MSLSSKTVMPTSTFRHISVMVFFMCILMGFCAFGLVSVTSIISSWTSDITDTITIEIPAFDSLNNSVLSDDEILANTQEIVDMINVDPSIIRMDSYRPDASEVIDDRFDIPTPVFLTLYLHSDRAPNSEDRISQTILKSAPQAIVKTPTQWIQNIQATATTLYFVFMGLMTCVLIVTGFVVAGVLRTQLIASKETITLIHLCGAPASKITNLFQSIIFKTVIKGCIPALLLMGFLITPLTAYLQLDSPLTLYWLSLPVIVIMLCLLAGMVTIFTVSSALRDMP
jgi:cell division protein FtsX